jgi:DNA-binding GntR family transcriptional regulator
MDFGADDEIDYEGPVTPYRQLAGILRARIARGDWAPNRAIASETQLVQQYGLARSTVRRAIAVLVEEGVLFVVPQRGTFVAGSADDAESTRTE